MATRPMSRAKPVSHLQALGIGGDIFALEFVLPWYDEAGQFRLLQFGAQAAEAASSVMRMMVMTQD